MTDRENVTEELKLLRDFLMSEERKAFKGNNNSAVNALMHYRNVVIDALTLLKEQEEKIYSAREIAMDESTNATWREDHEAWEVLDRIVQKLS